MVEKKGVKTNMTKKEKESTQTNEETLISMRKQEHREIKVKRKDEPAQELSAS